MAVHGDGGVRRLLLFIREKDEQKVLENFFSILADLAKKSKGKSKVFFICRGWMKDAKKLLLQNYRKKALLPPEWGKEPFLQMKE